MTDRSLLPAFPAAVTAVGMFRRACEHILNGNRDKAFELIRDLDRVSLRFHFDNVQAECGRRLNVAPLSDFREPRSRVSERMPGLSVQKDIFVRDGWRCRWCSTPIIFPGANKRMTRELPSLYPRGRRNIEIHGLMMCSQGSIDHVIVHALGGTNDPDNLVTACWPCQFARGEIDHVSLGLSDPRLREPIIDDWDGCRWFTN